MPIAITGGGGFVGRALINRLITENHQVRAFFRQVPGDLTPNPNLETVEGDLRDKSGISRLLKNCGCLIHLANIHPPKQTPKDSPPLSSFEYSAALFTQAAEAGVTKIIYLSTASVHTNNGGLIAENTPLKLSTDDPFLRQKIDCELFLETFCDENMLEFVILRPATIYGPGSKKLFPLFETVKKGDFFYIGSGLNQLSWVYIDDLIDAITTCIYHPVASGKKYIVSGIEELTLRKIVNLIAMNLDVKTPWLKVPALPVQTAVHVCEKLFPVFHRNSPITNASLKLFTESVYYSSEKIRKELNLPSGTSIKDGMNKIITEYLKNSKAS